MMASIDLFSRLLITMLVLLIYSVQSLQGKRAEVDFADNIKYKSIATTSTSVSADDKHPQDLPFRVKFITEETTAAQQVVDIDEWPRLDEQHFRADRELRFESPFLVESVHNCSVAYETVPDETPPDEYFPSVHQHHRSQHVRVHLSGASCQHVPLVLLELRWQANITHLVIANSGIDRLHRYYFGGAQLHSLRRLDIIDNPSLHTIDARAFDGLGVLRRLRLIDNLRAQYIEPEALVGLKKLVQLIWAHNAPVDQEMFVNMTRLVSKSIVPNLVHLYISSASSSSSSSSSTRIDLKLPKEWQQLQHLQLVNLDLVTISNLMDVQLQALSLAGAQRLDPQALVDSFGLVGGGKKPRVQSQLRLLDLSDTMSMSPRLNKLLLFALSKQPIRRLYLCRLDVLRIERVDIPPMPYIEQLYLDGNPIESIESNAFDQIENLELLSLRGNQLQTISADLWYNLPRLVHLDLAGEAEAPSRLLIEDRTFVGSNFLSLDLSNKLVDPLPSRAFLGLHKTERLVLRGCNITGLEYLTFFFLKSLKELDLSENPRLIKTLRNTYDDSFFGLETVESIKMFKCNLTTADMIIFARLAGQVQRLDLSHNRIDSLRPPTVDNNVTLSFNELQQLDLSHNNIQTWSNQSIFSWAAKLVQLDISHNQLHATSELMLTDLGKLTNVSFGHNPIGCDCSSPLAASGYLNTSTLSTAHFIDTIDPMHSRRAYYCLEEGGTQHLRLVDFVARCRAFHQRRAQYDHKVALVNSYLIVVLLVTTFAFTTGLLVTIFVYYNTLNKLFSGQWREENDGAGVYEYDAFVSYNAGDAEWIFTHLVPNIESFEEMTGDGQNQNQQQRQNRIKLCVYDRDFIAGRPISECILEAIGVSRRVILVVSNNFIQSPWCRFEADLAHNSLSKKTRNGLVLIKLEPLDEDMMIPAQLDFLLQTRIYLEWPREPDQVKRNLFWAKLRRALALERASRLEEVEARIIRNLQLWFERGNKSIGNSIGNTPTTNTTTTETSDKDQAKPVPVAL